jgi:cell wall-associated NlpC family hydrolase
VTLDHYAAFQWLEGERIAPDQLAPGDLVFFHMKPDGPGHVGLYAGNGQFIQAPHTGDVVKVSTLRDYASSYVGAVRPY